MTKQTTRSFKVLDKHTLWDGFFKLYRYRLRHQLFNGGWSAPLNRELLDRPPVVAVLPYDPVTDRVVLIQQFRLGTIGGEKPPWQWEIVAGLVEDHEDLQDVAYRETEEEAGITIGELYPIHRFWVSPGGTNEQVNLYCGIVDAQKAGGICGLAEEHEDIRVKAFPAQQVFTGLDEGWLDNATSLVAIQWLKLNHRQLSQKA